MDISLHTICGFSSLPLQLHCCSFIETKQIPGSMTPLVPSGNAADRLTAGRLCVYWESVCQITRRLWRLWFLATVSNPGCYFTIRSVLHPFSCHRRFEQDPNAAHIKFQLATKILHEHKTFLTKSAPTGKHKTAYNASGWTQESSLWAGRTQWTTAGRGDLGRKTNKSISRQIHTARKAESELCLPHWRCNNVTLGLSGGGLKCLSDVGARQVHSPAGFMGRLHPLVA